MRNKIGVSILWGFWQSVCQSLPVTIPAGFQMKQNLRSYMKNPILRNLATVSNGSMGEITNARYATGNYELVKDKLLFL